ncbi:hypothetical protein K458DRAFT_316707 [Lentithecium fluviatile CBS 122367]|uniref:EthD domain-containing protein n=1 Tax=Lentithecium fluviatile CBS 122367 TaxID=1168545 RepID=A0A6G1IL09_9PLEO|nr:hypothetical protein K458DRAFT_316707 [Lentithecium fluviatile CBS 122367]
MSPTKPGAIITVLYKRTPDLKFDLGYFQTTHVPLASKFWLPRGLMEAHAVIPTAESEFAFAMTMYWKSLEAWEDAMKVKEEMEVIRGDVGQFTNGAPLFVVGKVLP